MQSVSVNNATGRIECSISNKKNTHRHMQTKIHMYAVQFGIHSPRSSFFSISNCGQSQNSFNGKTIVRARAARKHPFILIFGIILRACKDTYVCVFYVCCVCVHRIIFLFVSHKFWLVIFVINQYYFRFSARPNSIRDSTNTEFNLPRRLSRKSICNDSTRLDSKTIIFSK